MSEFGIEFVAAIASRIGQPFRHHFRPENTCDYGNKTQPDCMTRGMDDRGYDCSGLSIAGICDVLGMQTENWPMGRRHLSQIADLAERDEAREGDMLYFVGDRIDTGTDEAIFRVHLGVLATGGRVIHANGSKDSQRVDDRPVSGYKLQSIIPLEKFVRSAIPAANLV